MHAKKTGQNKVRQSTISSNISLILNEASDILDNTYQKNIQFLNETDPFRFLISVILSAQTTDATVNKVAPQLFASYSNAQSLANADIEEVKKIIHSTGFFNSKAKNIIECAKIIHDEHNGEVPSSLEELIKLPGVGRKTANCLRSNILGLPGVVVDTHFSRVISRLLNLNTREPVFIEDIVRKNLQEDKWSRFSMTANAHGRDICHSTKPECMKCPLSKYCLSFLL